MSDQQGGDFIPHQHDFVPAPARVVENAYGTYKIPRPGIFVCSICGVQAEVGGAIEHPRAAHDASYRPDIPLRSSDESTATWADAVSRAERAKADR
jgi:hypothetical protein